MAIPVAPSVAPSSALAREGKTALLHVRFFGPVRTLLASEGIDLACPAPCPAEAFWRELLARFPEVETLRHGIRLARNGEFLGENENLRPGDEIALIPPVSGG